MPRKRNADERSRQRAIARRERRRHDYTPPGGAPDIWQIVVTDGRGNDHSFNIRGTGTNDDYDRAAVRRALKARPEILEQKRREFARRYHVKAAAIDIKNFKLHRIRRNRVAPRFDINVK